MSSIYQRALGADFKRLHPQIQRRFGFSSSDGLASIGTGVMEEILIVTASLLAAWIPATRAARLDPMQTLRQD